MQEERAGHVGGADELHERAMLAARVGLLGDRRVARPLERRRIALHGGVEHAVVPGREAVLLLRVVDHLAAGGRRGRMDGEREQSREDKSTGTFRHDDVLHCVSSATPARRIGLSGWLKKSTTTGA